ncbi:hypothetical protein PHYPSEUDO_005677 [Phytophthora pseudosyringae]|uniref:RING-type domain-containing protein n=1 Tax=Phytophthora pseudosyringae TaxID=221518 RepID=A0A8T1VKI3_9STRA|nr:hypothetical protein PHYPSEUDO_005677 [Phytophthora pseudosyringae]
MAPDAIPDTREKVCTDRSPITCQICLEELTSKGQTTTKPVTHFCSTTCPAVLCAPCLERHLQLSMQVPYAGALPKIRCPVCLVPVNKQQWSRLLPPDAMTTKHLLQQYRELCETSCSFSCPSCHNAQYTQLPEFHQGSGPDRANARALTLRPSEKTRIPELRRIVRRFCRHSKTATARDVIRHISDTFPASKTNCIVHKVLPLIQDEERRATLLLAYHAIHRRVKTRCCGAFACFNCKRSLYENNDLCACEQEDREVISNEDIIECRSCRVMIVKVDGCSGVWCVCGFSMDWTDEQRIKKLHQRKLLPVDPFDMTMYDHWAAWEYNFHCAAGEDRWELRESATLHSLNNSHPVFREALRQFIWKRRFRQLITNADLDLRLKFAIRLYPTSKDSLRALVWRRRRFHRRLLDEYRIAFVTRAARRQGALMKPVLLKFMWYCRFRRNVLGSLRRRFYCLSRGWGDLTEEQQEMEEDQLAMLSIGLN